jgi:hypothetical protein
MILKEHVGKVFSEKKKTSRKKCALRKIFFRKKIHSIKKNPATITPCTSTKPTKEKRSPHPPLASKKIKSRPKIQIPRRRPNPKKPPLYLPAEKQNLTSP